MIQVDDAAIYWFLLRRHIVATEKSTLLKVVLSDVKALNGDKEHFTDLKQLLIWGHISGFSNQSPFYHIISHET